MTSRGEIAPDRICADRKDAQVIVLGAGQAAVQFALGARASGWSGKLTIISDQYELPYQLPPLSKHYLQGQAGDDAVRLLSEADCAMRQIELVSGAADARIDRGRKCVCFRGRELHYDHLVIATGATPRRLPAAMMEADGVHTLRTLEDARALRNRLSGDGVVVIVGGGFLGLEVACVAAAKGQTVHLIEQGPVLMGRVVSNHISNAALRHHRALGVDIRLAAGLRNVLTHDGQVSGVVLHSGEIIAAETVVVCIGVSANTRLAEDAGLEVEDGIVVDEYLQTGDPDISAIGDCAAFPRNGRLVRVESVQNAGDQARYVAHRLMDACTPYDALPCFWSNQGSMRIQIAGLAADADQWLVVGQETQQRFSVFGFRKGALCSAESVNSPGHHRLARQLLTGSSSATVQTVSALVAEDLASATRSRPPARAIGR